MAVTGINTTTSNAVLMVASWPRVHNSKVHTLLFVRNPAQAGWLDLQLQADWLAALLPR